MRVLFTVVLALCLASTCLAFPPGTSVGVCLNVTATDRHIADTVSLLPSADRYGNREVAVFGDKRLTLASDLAPDTTVYIDELSNAGYAPYATQPNLFSPIGDPAEYIAFGEQGRGVASGGNHIKFLAYTSGTQTFSVTDGVFTNTTTRCYIRGGKSYVYQTDTAGFLVFTHLGAGLWALDASVPFLSSASDVMAFSMDIEEMATVGPSSTIAFYHVPGDVLPPVLIASFTPVGFVASEVTDIAYDHADNLIVGVDSLSSVFVFVRNGAGMFDATPTQTIPGSLPGSLFGHRLTTNTAPALFGLIFVTEPGCQPIGPDSRGCVTTWYSAFAGAPYTYSAEYQTQYSGTGAINNAIGRTDAVPQLAITSDPFDDYEPFYLDAVTGQTSYYCMESLDCDQFCGGTCDTDGSACTREVWVDGMGCVFLGPASVDDNNPCTVDTCDFNTGAVHNPITGGICDTIINGMVCVGTCAFGGCEITDPMCGMVTPTPTPSTTPSPSNTPSSSSTPSNTPTSTSTPSNTPSTSASSTPTVSDTATTTSTVSASPTPSISVTATSSLSVGASPSNTPSTTPSTSQTPSVSESATATSSVSPTSTNTPSVTASASSSGTVGCGVCLPFGNYTCNRLDSCTPTSCAYTEVDSFCSNTQVPSSCYTAVCDIANAVDMTGCVVVPKADGDHCDTDIPCAMNGRCEATQCVEIPVHDRCSSAENTQCSVNHCMPLGVPSFMLDPNGCAHVPLHGVCVHDDPCVVHSEIHPTFCNPLTFQCDGGQQIVCEPGSTCVEGTCQVDDCWGDDEDCYQPDDDDDDFGRSPGTGQTNDDDDYDDDDDNYKNSGWVLAIALFVLMCCCCLLLALYMSNYDRRDDRYAYQPQ